MDGDMDAWFQAGGAWALIYLPTVDGPLERPADSGLQEDTDQLGPCNPFQRRCRLDRIRISTPVLGCLEALSNGLNAPGLGRNRCMHNNQRITATTKG
jgi:hypothetical protein